jgi:hypothetical protein
VIYQLARFELARSQLQGIGIGIERKIAKRVNLGGVSLKQDDWVDFVLQGTSSDFAADLLKFAGITGWTIAGTGPESFAPCDFINQIWSLIECAPLDAPFSRAQPSIQNASIMTRYHIFQGTAQQDPAPPEPTHRPAPWSLEERQRLTDLIFRGVDPAQILPQFPGRTPDAVHRQYDRTWHRLCNHP